MGGIYCLLWWRHAIGQLALRTLFLTASLCIFRKHKVFRKAISGEYNWIDWILFQTLFGLCFSDFHISCLYKFSLAANKWHLLLYMYYNTDWPWSQFRNAYFGQNWQNIFLCVCSTFVHWFMIYDLFLFILILNKMSLGQCAKL